MNNKDHGWTELQNIMIGTVHMVHNTWTRTYVQIHKRSQHDRHTFWIHPYMQVQSYSSVPCKLSGKHGETLYCIPPLGKQQEYQIDLHNHHHPCSSTLQKPCKVNKTCTQVFNKQQSWKNVEVLKTCLKTWYRVRKSIDIVLGTRKIWHLKERRW